jgi:zinc transporter ZupT
LATNQSFSALARILGPMVGLPLFDKSSVYPYVAGAVVLILVAGLVLQIQRHESENQTEATPPTS